MELKNATLQEGRYGYEKDYVFEFEEQLREENKLIKRTIVIPKILGDAKSNAIQIINSSEVKEFILSNVKTLTVYEENKLTRELYYKIMEFIIKAQELSMNIKPLMYPGSTLIALEFGTLGINEVAVNELHHAVYKGIQEAEVTETIMEPEMEDKTEEPDPFDIGEEPFPLGGIAGNFVEDDTDFNLGVIEDDGEKEDDNG